MTVQLLVMITAQRRSKFVADLATSCIDRWMSDCRGRSDVRGVETIFAGDSYESEKGIATGKGGLLVQ